MNKKFLASFLLLGGAVYAEEVVIYGPKSMNWIGKKYAPIFKEKTGNDIKYVSVDSIVAKLKLEKRNPKADIVIGLTELNGEIAKREGFLKKVKVKNLEKIKNSKNIFDKEGYIIPVDYGMLAINYDVTALKDVPKTLKEIGALKQSLIVADPRSTTGGEFLLWSIALYEKEWKKFWQEIKPAIFTVASGWSEGFAKFSTGEVPMMTGYATSNIFFYQENEEAKYNSFIPEEGGYMYTEGAALVNKKEIKEAAEVFMNEILGEDFQKMVASDNYMFPVTKVELPKEFSYVPKTDKVVTLSPEEIKDLSENFEKYQEELVEFLRD
jgi:thiamine transport system substrate-binding protein